MQSVDELLTLAEQQIEEKEYCTVNDNTRVVTVPEWEQPDSTNPYAKGDKVTHNGKTWISTADGNVWEPGVYGWEEV